MYNKLFTKILDSSIWMAPDPQRIAWITLIAAMDENGFAQFASVANLAHRARITLEDCQQAVAAFEGPDPLGEDQEYQGRRIERTDGGWKILNAGKYRAMVNKAVANEQSRIRMQHYRDRLRGIAPPLRSVTPSEAVSEAYAEATASEGERGSVQRKRTPVSRGTRLPEPFEITQDMRQWAGTEFPALDVDSATAEFVDHWRSVPGSRGKKLNWEATWRNRMREIAGRQIGRQSATVKRTPSLTTEELERRLADAQQ